MHVNHFIIILMTRCTNHIQIYLFLEKLKEFQRRSETDTMIKRHNNKNIIIMSGWRRDSFK
jgi:hypothetical protein